MKAKEYREQEYWGSADFILEDGVDFNIVDEFAEEYANQRVIEELENMNNIINDLDDANMVLQIRIKQLKQNQDESKN